MKSYNTIYIPIQFHTSSPLTHPSMMCLTTVPSAPHHR